MGFRMVPLLVQAVGALASSDLETAPVLGVLTRVVGAETASIFELKIDASMEQASASRRRQQNTVDDVCRPTRFYAPSPSVIRIAAGAQQQAATHECAAKKNRGKCFS